MLVTEATTGWKCWSCRGDAAVEVDMGPQIVSVYFCTRCAAELKKKLPDAPNWTRLIGEAQQAMSNTISDYWEHRDRDPAMAERIAAAAQKLADTQREALR